jgi:transcriptional regulator with XRE-family HTH domain
MDTAELARRVGYKGPGMLQKIFRGEARPSFEKMEEIAEALEVPIGDLLPNSGANPALDRLEPILAAMFGLSEDAQSELLASLAVQARTMAGWRRRDVPAEKRSRRHKRVPASDEEHDLSHPSQ